MGEEKKAKAPSRSFAERIAALAEHLPSPLARSWAEVLSASDTLERLPERLLAAYPGPGLAHRATELAEAWRYAPDLSGPAVAAALVAASAAAARADERRARVVVTGPAVQGSPTRLTAAAVVQLIRSAREELLVVSFAAHRSARLAGELRAAAARGVTVDLVLEDSTGAAAPLSLLDGHARFWNWPPENRGGEGKASLHAKVLAADRERALVGSANLTGRALNDNIEVGVLLNDPQTVGGVVGHFRSLMRQEGPLRPVAPFPE
ncbi:DISARM system phospholipase D-like protein DrmC [Nocardiopsis potens]|uniref:DISARM system phospholipase D-like protein DrmC n=1 Tax=Nocardiopsis potens TaxID=1246458 RepID=UPI0003486A91|nr:DISARM system phospholipase D-like protein DrmC [Nocardiopsis potens]